MTGVATDPWTPADLPDQGGKTVVVTGCSLGGIGYHTALELARRNARVVLAGRSQAKLAEAEEGIRGEVPHAQLSPRVVDRAHLGSVRRAGAHAHTIGPIDVLVNNAGVMAPPYSRTVDGFELQMATNHLGPFLLTGLLLPQLVRSNAARVVTVSSLMHQVARRAPQRDPRRPRSRYLRWPEYGETKLANLLFTYELDRRCREAGLPVTALAAHPGFAGTHLAANGQYGRASGGRASILDAAIKVVAQSAHSGSLPILMAATADLPGGTYCGPSSMGETRGLPGIVGSTRLSHDRAAQRELWELSQRAVGLQYP